MIRAAALALLLPLTVPRDDSEIRDGKTFVSKFHNLTFTVPSAQWGTLRVGRDLEWKCAGALCEGTDGSKNLGLALTAEKSSKKMEEYAEFFEKSVSAGPETKKFERTGGNVLEGRPGEWCWREYEWESQTFIFKLLAIFTRQGNYDYKLIVWTEKRFWDEKRSVASAIVDSFALLDGNADHP